MALGNWLSYLKPTAPQILKPVAAAPLSHAEDVEQKPRPNEETALGKAVFRRGWVVGAEGLEPPTYAL